MTSWIPVLTTIHILGAITFVLAHGISMVVGFRVKMLSEPDRLRPLLKLSAQAVVVSTTALLVVLVSGILGGIAAGWFTSGRYWIWVSLVLLVAVGAVMFPLATAPLARIRWAMGDKFDSRLRKQLPTEPPGPDELPRMLAAWNPMLPATVGGVGLALILWMMLAKPF